MSMKVEQAIFASSNRGRVQGYQLVAKSAGVDKLACQELSQWAPSQPPSSDPSEWTVNTFALSDGRVAVTRTTLGGPEYSCRGGDHVVTLILLLSQPQFHQYDCDAIALARTALITGNLRLPLDLSREHLDLVVLPQTPLVEVDSVGPAMSLHDSADDLISQTIELVRAGRRVAVVGHGEPIDAVAELISHLSVQQRAELSFTTGLPPALSRPFQVHFLREADAAKQRLLSSQGIVCLDANQASPV